MIHNNKAFIVKLECYVWLRHCLCMMVILSVFQCRNRDLFGSPVNHRIIWEAVRYSQSIDVKTLNLEDYIILNMKQI